MSTPSPNPLLEQDDLKALYEDPHYGKYDPFVTYMSMRYENRDQFLESLNPGLQLRIKHEMARIDKLRTRISRQQHQHQVLAPLKENLKQWKNEAKTNQAQNILEVEKRRSRLFAVSVPADEEGENRWSRMYKRLANEMRILKAISQWPLDQPSIPPRVAGEPADAETNTYGFKAPIMYFNKGAGGHTHNHKHPKVTGVFPNQKIEVKYLLADTEDNPLKEPCLPNRIRYFHLPANNMAWVEKVIARYFGDSDNFLLSRNDLGRPTRTEILLSNEFWQGQMLGGFDAPVAGRHMRPLCLSVDTKSSHCNSETISELPSVVPVVSNDKRGPAALDVDTPPHSMRDFIVFMPYLHWETRNKLAKMTKIVFDVKKRHSSRIDAPVLLKGQDGKTDFFHAAEVSVLRRHKYEGTKVSRSKYLGPFLMSVAKVYDAMDHESDESLLRDHLQRRPPLHVRRTLDQSYFSSFDDTGSRSRDQVVYRGTKGGNYNTRVVMVDQLWMWILDENTIITSFPRRWGRNKPDTSGIHKSLRDRLIHLPASQINTVFDIAFIIIDQCSRVFFDRTKPLDQRPEVMDIFSNTISQMTFVLGRFMLLSLFDKLELT